MILRDANPAGDYKLRNVENKKAGGSLLKGTIS
jgi:hypothetical protein